MTKIMQTITIPFEFWASHKYENAPKDVEFLRELHPHNFICELELQVLGNDRELEFYLVQDFVRGMVESEFRGTISHKSCEMFCDEIYKIVKQKYPGRWTRITVSEDNIFKSSGVWDGQD